MLQVEVFNSGNNIAYSIDASHWKNMVPTYKNCRLKSVRNRKYQRTHRTDMFTSIALIQASPMVNQHFEAQNMYDVCN